VAETRPSRYLAETLAVTRFVRMTDVPRASKDDFGGYRLWLLLLACLALGAWSAVQSKPAPGIKRAPTQAPAKQLPKQRTNPTGDPEPVC
jgi:hypothetical protein